MSADFIERFRSLQKYVNWTDDDLARLPLIEQTLRPFHRDLVDDFYTTLAANPQTLKTIVGGTEQIERLKVSLLIWLEELLAGKYDADYLLAR